MINYNDYHYVYDKVNKYEILIRLEWKKPNWIVYYRTRPNNFTEYGTGEWSDEQWFIEEGNMF